MYLLKTINIPQSLTEYFFDYCINLINGNLPQLMKIYDQSILVVKKKDFDNPFKEKKPV